MKKALLIIGVLIILAAVAVYMSLDKIIIFTLSKFYGISVSYTSLVKDRVNGHSFENLKVLNKRIGVGFFSARANIKMNKRKTLLSLLKSVDIDFKFRDVHFIRSKPEKVQGVVYDSLNKLVAAPFEGRWKYREVSGTVEMFSNGLTLKSFTADGNDIRLTMSGDLFYNNQVNMNITVCFSKNVLKDIPPELHTIVMEDEPDEWKSFSVKMKGDYRSPSLQLTGKLFRLNIKTVVMND